MSEDNVKTSVKSYRRKPTKESKLDSMYYVLKHPNLTNIERLVALYLIQKARFCPQANLEKANLDSFDGPGYYTRYTQAKLAKQMKVSQPTISRAIKKLDEEKLINNHPGRCNQGKYGYQGVAFVAIPGMKKEWGEQTYYITEKEE